MKKRLKLLNQKGLSLLEAIFCVAVISLAIFIPTSLIQKNKQGINNTRSHGDALSILYEIRNSMSVANTCLANFNQVDVSGVPKSPLGNQIVGPGVVTVSIGSPRPQENVTITKALVGNYRPFEPTAPSLGGTLDFQIEFRFSDQQTSSWTIPMWAQVDGANKITNCMVGQWQKSFWQDAITAPGGTPAISYSGSPPSFTPSIGIGTPPVPGYSFALNGDFGAATSYNQYFSIAVRPYVSAVPGSTLIDSNFSQVEAHYDLSIGGNSVFYLTYEMSGGGSGRGTTGQGTFTDSSFKQHASNVCTMKLEGTNPGKIWKIHTDWQWGSEFGNDARPNGMRFESSIPSQNLVMQSRLVVGNENTLGTDLFVDGFAGGWSNFVVSSDLRLKKEVKNLPATLKDIQNVEGVEFQFKKDHKKSIGFIAQNLMKSLPLHFQNIVQNEGPFLGVRYSEMIPLLTKSLQELSEKQKVLKIEKTKLIESLCQKYPSDLECHELQ